MPRLALALLLALFAPAALACDAARSLDLSTAVVQVRPDLVAPSPLGLKAGFVLTRQNPTQGRSPHASYKLGQGLAVGFLGTAATLQVATVAIAATPNAGGATTNYLAGALWGMGGISAVLGSGISLGAAASLRRDGWTPVVWPGWVAVGVSALGIATLPLSIAMGNPSVFYVGLAAAPVATGFGIAQVVVNHKASKQPIQVSVVPTPDGGVMSAMTIRF